MTKSKLVKNLDNAIYHAGPELSASGLKLLQKSPAHYWARNIDPERKPNEPTPSMMFGTAVHCAILEPAEITKRYTVLPDGFTKQSNANKQLFADIIASGKTPISMDDWAIVEKIKKKALANIISKSVFANVDAIIEGSIFFERDGVSCRCRPDVMVGPCQQWPNGIIVDVKTATDAGDVEFGKSAFNYSYHLQAEFYMDGFRRHFETDKLPIFVFYVIENTSPFLDNLFMVDMELAEYAENINKRLIAKFSDCQASGIWPGYDKTARLLTIPGWIKNEINDFLRGR